MTNNEEIGSASFFLDEPSEFAEVLEARNFALNSDKNVTLNANVVFKRNDLGKYKFFDEERIRLSAAVIDGQTEYELFDNKLYIVKDGISVISKVDDRINEIFAKSNETMSVDTDSTSCELVSALQPKTRFKMLPQGKKVKLNIEYDPISDTKTLSIKSLYKIDLSRSLTISDPNESEDNSGVPVSAALLDRLTLKSIVKNYIWPSLSGTNEKYNDESEFVSSFISGLAQDDPLLTGVWLDQAETQAFIDINGSTLRSLSHSYVSSTKKLSSFIDLEDALTDRLGQDGEIDLNELSLSNPNDPIHYFTLVVDDLYVTIRCSLSFVNGFFNPDDTDSTCTLEIWTEDGSSKLRTIYSQRHWVNFEESRSFFPIIDLPYGTYLLKIWLLDSLLYSGIHKIYSTNDIKPDIPNSKLNDVSGTFLVNNIPVYEELHLQCKKKSCNEIRYGFTANNHTENYQNNNVDNGKTYTFYFNDKLNYAQNMQSSREVPCSSYVLPKLAIGDYTITYFVVPKIKSGYTDFSNPFVYDNKFLSAAQDRDLSGDSYVYFDISNPTIVSSILCGADRTMSFDIPISVILENNYIYQEYIDKPFYYEGEIEKLSTLWAPVEVIAYYSHEYVRMYNDAHHPIDEPMTSLMNKKFLSFSYEKSDAGFSINLSSSFDNVLLDDIKIEKIRTLFGMKLRDIDITVPENPSTISPYVIPLINVLTEDLFPIVTPTKISTSFVHSGMGGVVNYELSKSTSLYNGKNYWHSGSNGDPGDPSDPSRRITYTYICWENDTWNSIWNSPSDGVAKPINAGDGMFPEKGTYHLTYTLYGDADLTLNY